MKNFLEAHFDVQSYELFDWQVIGRGVTLKKDFAEHRQGSYFTFLTIDLESNELRLENVNEELEEGDEEVLISNYPINFKVKGAAPCLIRQLLLFLRERLQIVCEAVMSPSQKNKNGVPWPKP